MKKILFLPIILLFIFLFSPIHSFADIIVIRVNGVVNPVMSEFISKNIDIADEEHGQTVVIEIETPGGLEASKRSRVSKII